METKGNNKDRCIVQRVISFAYIEAKTVLKHDAIATPFTISFNICLSYCKYTGTKIAFQIEI